MRTCKTSGLVKHADLWNLHVCRLCNVSSTKHLNNVSFSGFTRARLLINSDLTAYFWSNATLNRKSLSEMELAHPGDVGALLGGSSMWKLLHFSIKVFIYRKITAEFMIEFDAPDFKWKIWSDCDRYVLRSDDTMRWMHMRYRYYLSVSYYPGQKPAYRPLSRPLMLL